MTNGDWQCADGGHLDDLHLRAASRDYHALHELASRLTERDMHGELRELASAADADRRLVIFTRPERQVRQG